MKIHFILHESFEGPGAIALWAQMRGHQSSYTHLYAGDVLPKDLKDIDFLIVMGGPQSTVMQLKECSYFDAAAEIELIDKAIQQGKRILGICLGAQLVGEAYGAKAQRSPHKEIGVYPIHLTEDGQQDPMIGSWPLSLMVAHWHSDMPGLPAQAVILAQSVGCPRQIIRFADGVYGFQCHLEFTKSAAEEMIQNNPNDFSDSNVQKYMQDQNSLLSYDYSQMNAHLFKFLDNTQCNF